VSAALILSRGDVAALMAPADWLEAVETGFLASAEGKASAPPPMAIESESGAFHAKGAVLRLDRSYVALKLNGNFPGNPQMRGLPTIQGAILLCDGEDGSVLAIMDSIEVTLRRTAAATALAARYLARPDSRTILICGCGDQGAAQLAALREVLPLGRCFAWDQDRAKAEAFAAAVRSEGLEAEAVSDLATAAPASDAIVGCTTARRAYLEAAFVRPGTFVAAIGADSPEKSEIEPALMAGATVVADVRAQCEAMGDLRHAVAAGAMRAEDVHAELHELVKGTRPGRTRGDEITLFDSTGTALQDVAAAATIFERARERPGLRRVALGE
jgi:alanine dehydrogenase